MQESSHFPDEALVLVVERSLYVALDQSNKVPFFSSESFHTWSCTLLPFRVSSSLLEKTKSHSSFLQKRKRRLSLLA